MYSGEAVFLPNFMAIYKSVFENLDGKWRFIGISLDCFLRNGVSKIRGTEILEVVAKEMK